MSGTLCALSSKITAASTPECDLFDLSYSHFVQVENQYREHINWYPYL
ncbi:hypothetical protein HWQ46_18750 [Shewanella sp. D64]|nr:MULTISPECIES: hypothetical protein [unclassified Shewanella]MEC4727588.1 hypothetical protein [Shewanella sp. D64]MEC4739839.1 hypothetical protein [Shewanella sp. E94]WBJ95775.1 hypothetical protein HWQ47_01145 [Shewanella sp. MTB7]